jgi:hypothetical protein
MPPRAAPNPHLAQVKALGDSFALLKDQFGVFKTNSEVLQKDSERRDKVLLEKIKVLTAEKKALKTRIEDLERVSYAQEVDDDDDLGPNSREPSTLGPVRGSSEAGNEGQDGNEEMVKVERSAEAADSNVIKVSAHLKLDMRAYSQSVFACIGAR